MLGRNSFWLALLFHLLLLMVFSLVWMPEPVKLEEKPHHYIPAYTYHEEIKPVSQQPVQPVKQIPLVQTSKIGIEKPVIAQQSIRQTSSSQSSVASHTGKNTEAIHLIGDKKLDQPLIKLLAKALTARLFYPKIAVDFQLRGTAIIGFVIHPDGQVTDVKLVKSSQIEVLDQAAVEAAKTMGPVKNVDRYLQQPRYLTIGIIYG